jgi:tetratricopeptide (TPR) repeat protein
MLKGMESQIKFAGPATGLYCEMGMLYRLIEDYKGAVEYYHKEINLGLKRDGLPGVGTARAFSNLGVVYKKLGKYDLALDSFRVALGLNSNYFECLISMSGLANNINASLALMGRAYRIRAGDPLWQALFQNASAGFGLPVQEIVQKVEDLSTKVDLSAKTEIDRDALKRLGF